MPQVRSVDDQRIENVAVKAVGTIPSPGELKRLHEVPVFERMFKINAYRQAVRSIVHGESAKMLIIVGPCSIHNVDEALEYACLLAQARQQFGDKLEILMRVYGEKPRTTTGWPGLIADPYLDGTMKIADGLRMMRKLMIDITKLGVPCATEFVDALVPQYIADLVCWAAIGARTVESPTHRYMASGLSMPVGLKNGSCGNTEIAVNAICSAQSPHVFLGIDDDGAVSRIETLGNADCHMVLRGGVRPNYFPGDVDAVQQQLRDKKVNDALIVDCNHGNSGKVWERQGDVVSAIVNQRLAGNTGLVGLMIESNLEAGNQSSASKKGVSITDACASWAVTHQWLSSIYQAL